MVHRVVWVAVEGARPSRKLDKTAAVTLLFEMGEISAGAEVDRVDC